MSRRADQHLLLGEWACLGAVYPAPIHGFAVAARLKPDGDIGRVWSMSRALTYRSLDQLVGRGYVEAVGEEPGIAGGNRTILAVTRTGRAQLRHWVATPVAHLRDLRSELLVKLVVADLCSIDVRAMLAQQRERVAELGRAIDDTLAGDAGATTVDPVLLWRSEASHAAQRFLDRLLGP